MTKEEKKKEHLFVYVRKGTLPFTQETFKCNLKLIYYFKYLLTTTTTTKVFLSFVYFCIDRPRFKMLAQKVWAIIFCL